MTNEQQKRMDELISVLTEASRAYYDAAQEIMSNYEYDALYDELEALEKETGYQREDSPTRNVGYTVQSELPKERHPSRMLSLDKTKSREELQAWLGDQTGLLSWKLDGLTVVLHYADGRLAKAVTRGNGDIGEVITENAKAFVNVPRRIAWRGDCIIRGEAVIRYEDFERINASIEDADAKYKNPRNLCSGSVRQLDPRVTAERSVRFYAFTLTNAEGVDFGGSREAQMRWMAEQGFEVVPYVRVDASNLQEALSHYEEEIPDFPIPSDGLVLTLEDLVYAASLGTTAKFPRDSMAFKWADQQAETTLREIEWSPSRTGLLNPVAVFDPVELEGTTVRRASVHNLNMVEELALGIGDTIRVYKANMIIPQISENLTRSGNLEIPSACPVCGGRTAVDAMNDSKVLRCTNPDCIAKQVKRFSLFVSRDAMNIEGLSEQTLLKLIGAGLIRTPDDIFRLHDHKEELLSLDGFKEKLCANLLASIEKARATTPTRILVSLGIPGVGAATAAAVAKACRQSWEKMESLTEEELLSIDGVGEVLAHDYRAFFSEEGNRAAVRRLIEQLTIDETPEETGNRAEGKTFVITGSLEHFANRKDLKAAIEKEGGKVAGSVSGKTDYLITNTPDSGSSKNKAARELGVAVITEEEAMRLLGL